MQKAIVIFVFALLLGAGAYLMWVNGEGEIDLGSTDTGRAAAPPTTAASASGEVPSAPTNTAEATVAGDDAGARDAVLAANPDGRPLPEDADWITITVVDKATGNPVAGASVFWHDESAWDHLQTLDGQLRYDNMLWRDHERLCTKAGWRTRTDKDGKAKVAVTTECNIYAVAEAGYGLLVARRNTVEPAGGYRLLLEGDRRLLLQVVDAAGQPAVDVPVQLVPLDEKQNPQHHYGWMTLAKTKAPDGTAEILHIQLLQQEARDQHELDLGKVRWYVRPALPGLETPGEPVDLENPPTETIVLRLPPCGAVHVRAQIAGQPVPNFISAQMSSDDSDGVERKFQTWCSTLTDPDGVARFAHVPLRTPLHVGANAGGGMWKQVTGPAQQGQVVEVTLTTAAEALLLRGRLVDAERQPMRKRQIRGELRGPELRNWLHFETADDGTFMVTAGTNSKNNAMDQCFLSLHQTDRPPLRAEVTARTLRPGIEELGDLMMKEPPVLVAGRFASPDGAPFTKNVDLHVEREEPTRDGKSTRWRGVQTTEFCDKTGGFRVYGTVERKRHRLHVHPGSALSQPAIDFEPGRTDLLVTLTPGTPLAASVLLPAQAPTQMVRATLVPAEPPPKAPDGKTEEPPMTHPEKQQDERYDLRWSALRPGIYTLELRLWTQAAPLIRITDVHVPPQEGGDPRLLDIDLRAMVRLCQLELLDREGKSLSPDNGVLVPAGLSQDSEWEGHPLDENTTQLLLPVDKNDWMVMVPGYRPQQARFGSDKTTLRLEPWPTLNVTVAGIPELPAKARLMVSAALENAPKLRIRKPWDTDERDDLLSPGSNQVQLENGRAEVAVGEGMHRLTLTLRANRKSHEFQGITPDRVFSTAGSVSLQVPPEQWEQAMAAVRPANEQKAAK